MDAVDLLALCRVPRVSWHLIAREAQRPDGLARLLAASTTESGPDAEATATRLREARDDLDRHREWVSRVIEEVAHEGIGLTTVLDDDYPTNLRLIFNLPPFLFYRGQLRPDDARAVAVVGTRQPTPDGVKRAGRLASGLASANVTVLSGLARGIDTAAHEATLDAGGRTIAVLGTGIRRTYPPENALLAERIMATGALVSQFWPDTPPRTDTFPRRNVVTSGMGQGTAVIEASSTSGAKMQARLAMEHGKRVFLLATLVESHPWTHRYVERGAIVVHSVDDILRLLQSPAALKARSDNRQQLSLALG
jgi:DNA processing protein